jgi:hypothetical protein
MVDYYFEINFFIKYLVFIALMEAASFCGPVLYGTTKDTADSRISF